MITVIRADTRDIVDTIREAHFAAMITDPPYSLRVHSNAVSLGTQGNPRARAMGFDALDDGLRFALARIAASVTGWTVVFSDIEDAHLWHAALTSEGPDYVRTVPWVRWSQPQLSGDRPPSGCELVTLVHAPGAKKWSGPGSLTAFDTRSLRGADKYPCEKPLDLMLSLVSWFSCAGDAIVDPCAGAGTTGLAARLLDRDAVLVELDMIAHDRAQSRIESDLSDRDRERCERWLDYQRKWLGGEPASTNAGAARYARATADTERVARALGGTL